MFQKSLSSLDLKLLDVKFISISDNQAFLTEALQSVRRAKVSMLPSLLNRHSSQIDDVSSFNNDQSIIFKEQINKDPKNRSTIESISPLNQTRFKTKVRNSDVSWIEDRKDKNKQKSLFGKLNETQIVEKELSMLKDEIRQRHMNYNASSIIQIKKQSKAPLSLESEAQAKQLQKYRRKIEQIRKQNLMIHKEISTLYRTKINQLKQPLKKVRKIQLYSESKEVAPQRQQQDRDLKKTLMKLSKTGKKQFSNTKASRQSANKAYSTNGMIQKSRFDRSLSKQIHKKFHFYENLSSSEQNLQQVESIHKKLINSNLSKNLQSYLVQNNKRVPEFIKKLRN